MSNYRRSLIKGATYFFTLTLADRKSNLLVEEINRLRKAYTAVNQRYPFQTIAICVLPDHLHAIWTLPLDDQDYSLRWQLIKRNFSTGLPARAKQTNVKKASGSAYFGNIKSVTISIYNGMLITFITIRSNMDWSSR
jgi:REP element-mobilizing transposase RayT